MYEGAQDRAKDMYMYCTGDKAMFSRISGVWVLCDIAGPWCCETLLSGRACRGSPCPFVIMDATHGLMNTPSHIMFTWKY